MYCPWFLHSKLVMQRPSASAVREGINLANCLTNKQNARAMNSNATGTPSRRQIKTIGAQTFPAKLLTVALVTLEAKASDYGSGVHETGPTWQFLRVGPTSAEEKRPTCKPSYRLSPPAYKRNYRADPRAAWCSSRIISPITYT